MLSTAEPSEPGDFFDPEGPADLTRGTVLEPLTPDRLAEDFVALTLPGHTADYPAYDWAPTALNALLPHTDRVSPPPGCHVR